MFVPCILLAIGLVSSAAIDGEATEKDSRSVILPGPNCAAQWQANNPCVKNPLNKLNFAFPSDNTKFIQCGTFARMFVIQCPPGEQYDQATSSCVKANAIVSQPIITSPAGHGASNPCTAQNIHAGRFFFGLTADSTKFIECDEFGVARILTCPSQMDWDQSRQSCVFLVNNGAVLNPGTVGTGIGSPSGIQTTSNPCNAHAISTSQLFFSHPDPTKFIQCDLQGHAFVQQCPSGLVWNQYVETCASQLATLAGGNQSNGPLIAGGVIYA